MRPAELDLRIDEIVVHGYDPGDRRAFADALQRELARLFSQPADSRWQAGAAQRSLDVGRIDLPHGATPPLAAARVAGAIHRGIVRPPPAPGSRR